MRRHINLKRATAIIDAFPRARVLVIGDLILDHFVWGKVRRISPEAPVPIVEVTSESVMLGGAANVVSNVVSLGGRAMLAGVVGKDDGGGRFMRLLREKGIPSDGVVATRQRLTTVKTRIIAHHQQVVRFDREEKGEISASAERKVADYVRRAAPDASVTVVSDYAKGLVTERLFGAALAASGEAGRPVLVDPKVAHMDYYRGAEVVTPNNVEASEASGVEIADGASLRKAGRLLLGRLGCKALLVTRGEHGMSLFEDDSQTDIPTVAREVFDVSGAGDTVIATLALAIASGATHREAAVIANCAAGVVVGKVGTAALDRDELKEAVASALKAWPKGKNGK